jgi:predicted nuclease of predicted toxin-antitoxin system
MPAPIRFHLDEHINPAIANGLRRRGIDVTATVESGLQGATDEEHLAFARAERRVIITHDDDYLRLHQQGIPHAGIVYCRQQTRSIGEMLRTLLLIWAVLTPEEMENHVEFLSVWLSFGQRKLEVLLRLLEGTYAVEACWETETASCPTTGAVVAPDVTREAGHAAYFSASSMASSSVGVDIGRLASMRHVPSGVRTHSAGEMPPSCDLRRSGRRYERHRS